MSDKIDLEQARAGFRPGLYRHFKGGLYLATGLVEHSETTQTLVVYRSLEYGKDWLRALASPDEDSWTDVVPWPEAGEAGRIWHSQGKDNWPWGHRAPRFVLCPPFEYLLLVSGHPQDQAVEAAREFQQVEVSPLVAGIPKTLAVLRGSLKATVLPLHVTRNGETEAPGFIPIEVGDHGYLVGQIRGVLAVMEASQGGLDG